jgi:hypothetical protein
LISSIPSITSDRSALTWALFALLMGVDDPEFPRELVSPSVATEGDAERRWNNVLGTLRELYDGKGPGLAGWALLEM